MQNQNPVESIPSTVVSLNEVCEFCGLPLPACSIAFAADMGVRFGSCDCPVSLQNEERLKNEAKVKSDTERAIHLEKQRLSRVRINKATSGIPPRFSDCFFETFDSSKSDQAFKTCFRYASEFRRNEGNGLLLAGTPGLGKTHLSVAISFYLLENGFFVKFGTVPALLSGIRRAYDRSTDLSEYDAMSELIDCDLLVMDDFGKEKPSEWAEERLYEIINTRYEQRKSIVVTTNIELADIEKRYPWGGEAMVSRLYEICVGLRLEGADHRCGL